MRAALRGVIGVGRDLVLGDDPWVALALAAGLGASWALTALDAPAWWILPAVVVASTVASLRRATRVSSRGSPPRR